jgi:uncharacterized RmlC-like cupin family protein
MWFASGWSTSSSRDPRDFVYIPNGIPPRGHERQRHRARGRGARPHRPDEQEDVTELPELDAHLRAEA